ncbi:MAG: hypothetical protein PHW92_11765 [Lutibacter sp.]|nr:hypothetical protein [Lutibacter sp.]
MGLFNFIKLNKNKDLRKSECPYCKNVLEKIPGKKTKCKNCSNFIIVRTTPKDNNRVLVTEEDARKIDLEWAKINGTYDNIIKEENELNEIREGMRKKYGKNPSERVVMWSYLNSQLLEHIKNNNWGSYTSVKRKMAEILKKENKLEASIIYYLMVCYLEINGANDFQTDDPELLKERPFFDPSYYYGISPRVICGIKKIATERNLKIEDIKKIFIDRNNVVRKRTPLSPEECWPEVEKKLFNLK